MIGILPTLRRDQLTATTLSANPRYALLNEQIFAARGEDLPSTSTGSSGCDVHSDSIAPEAACTSVQFHLQVAPEDFAAHWNASQAIAGIQVAVGANSPFLFGKRLWAETRIALFEQATDTRPEELKAQGVRPRVWFGERWITSIFDLFEENVRYFPALLPICDDEDPVAVLDGRRRAAPRRAAAAQRHDLPLEPPGLRRRERQAAPARREPGPARRADRRRQLANAAFYFGLVGALAEQDRPIWTADVLRRRRGELPHRRPRRHSTPRSVLARPGEVPVADLVLRRLLPAGIRRPRPLRRRPGTRDRLLGVIEGRCRTGRNGAAWQTETVNDLQARHHLDRRSALREMLQRYSVGLHANEPVHTWPI